MGFSQRSCDRNLKMKTSGLPGLLLLLLMRNESTTESVVNRSYYYFSSLYTWEQAQTHCRRHHTDLAIIHTQSDLDEMQMDQYCAWTGLYKSSNHPSSPYYYWSWLTTGYTTATTWASSEPDLDDECAYVCYSDMKYYGASCDAKFFPMCMMSDQTMVILGPQVMTWHDALSYCRKMSLNLAHLLDSTLSTTVTAMDFPVWTGLFRGDQDPGQQNTADVWEWSAGVSSYRHWASHEPSSKGGCVTISSINKQMSAKECSSAFPFVCFRDNLVLVKERKPWEEALMHCRRIGLELVSVEPGDQSQMMAAVMQADTDWVWTGLRFLASDWLWVNGAEMLYSDLPLCPPDWQFCGALSKENINSLETAHCSQALNFLCYSAQ